MPTKLKTAVTGEMGVLYITLKGYLNQLTAEQRSYPEGQRKHVPTMEELAERIGVHPVTLSNLVTGKVKLLNLDLGGRILTELHTLGFDTKVSDIISYRPPPQKE